MGTHAAPERSGARGVSGERGSAARRGDDAVSDVRATYFALRELDLELEIARKTRAIAQDGLRLTKLRHDQGAATGLDVHQAEQFLYTATAQIASIERDIGQTENALSLLLGNAPARLRAAKALEDLSRRRRCRRIAVGAARTPSGHSAGGERS